MLFVPRPPSRPFARAQIAALALTGCGAVAPLDAEPPASADLPVSPPPVSPVSPPRAFGEVGLGENYSVASFRCDRCVATAVDGCVVHRCPNPAISEDAGLLRVIAPGFERSFEAIPRGFLQGSYESIGTISGGVALRRSLRSASRRPRVR